MGQRELLRELLRVLPVRGDMASVQQAGMAKRERAGADRAVAVAMRGHGPEPGGEAGIWWRFRQRGAARYQCQVEAARGLPERLVHHKLHAVRRAQGARRGAEQRDLIVILWREKAVSFGKDI